ncbi:MAG TPA: hypothetical protein PK438_08485 [Clostridia bacterium]|nr:MAG: hypothetical protein BWY35_01374 [Firmicutes bacterium ADurb.Bin248]HOG01971.1 hypothetical protein [Clostridia bacterium]HOS19313.1 hypothetical protein [Clostridia bacterium]HPK15632.1 hypothetical protein [Clostridia bacterium]
MRTALIKDGLVVNIIVADESVYAELGQALGAALVNADGIECGIGWVAGDGGRFFPPPAEASGQEDREPAAGISAEEEA